MEISEKTESLHERCQEKNETNLRWLSNEPPFSTLRQVHRVQLNERMKFRRKLEKSCNDRERQKILSNFEPSKDFAHASCKP